MAAVDSAGFKPLDWALEQLLLNNKEDEEDEDECSLECANELLMAATGVDIIDPIFNLHPVVRGANESETPWDLALRAFSFFSLLVAAVLLSSSLLSCSCPESSHHCESIAAECSPLTPPTCLFLLLLHRVLAPPSSSCRAPPVLRNPLLFSGSGPQLGRRLRFHGARSENRCDGVDRRRSRASRRRSGAQRHSRAAQKE